MLENIKQSRKGSSPLSLVFAVPQEAENTLRLMQNKLKEEEKRLLRSGSKAGLSDGALSSGRAR